MMKKAIPFLLLVVASFVFIKCGQRGSPTGGPKDDTSPVIEESLPKNNATNFIGQKIVFKFDEYVKVASFYNEFIISPPIKTKPEYNLKGKKLILTFDSIFSANTTYSLFLGKAVKDLNGGNALEKNHFVFSTGDFVDSLSYSGEIFDAKTMKPFEKGMVHLYKTTSDSVQTLEIPSYFAQVKSGKFQFTNLAAGTYKIFGLNDINGNYLYDLPNEEISFTESLITVNENQDSSMLKLISFQPENSKQFISNYACKNSGAIRIKFNNPVKNLKIDIEGKSFKKDWKMMKWNEKRDSLLIWSTALAELDSFKLNLDFDGIKDTLNFNVKKLESAKEIAINVSHNMNNMANTFKDSLRLFFNKPISSYVTSLLVLECGDKVEKVNIKQINGLTNMVLLNQLKPEKQYEFSILPGGVQSVFGDTNKDTIHFHFNTAAAGALSDLIFKYDFSQIKSSGILEFWVGQKRKAVYYIDNPIGELTLPGLTPDKYKFKFIEDTDNNRRWSSGDYWMKKQPEKVYWYKEEVTVRANWEMEVEWKLIP
jgi:hypothetical protein